MTGIERDPTFGVYDAARSDQMVRALAESMLARSNPDDMTENRPPVAGGLEGEDEPGAVP
jgi:hypothetical protein